MNNAARDARDALQQLLAPPSGHVESAVGVIDYGVLENALDVLNDLTGPQLYEVEVEAVVSGTVEVEANSEAEAQQVAIKAVEDGSAEACYIEAESSDLYFEPYPNVHFVGKV